MSIVAIRSSPSSAISHSSDENEPVRDHFPPPLLCRHGRTKVGAAPNNKINLASCNAQSSIFFKDFF